MDTYTVMIGYKDLQALQARADRCMELEAKIKSLEEDITNLRSGNLIATTEYYEGLRTLARLLDTALYQARSLVGSCP
jgi:hypothetical protein